ncbi:fungal-specific transcription factor domain-containing protein [Hysterangium stoloniferum]|nr:fungal-specific transcription factor domain-containing protein [Hysterangium stoloniferum]
MSLNLFWYRYLTALESRIHEAEALLGAIISSPQADSIVNTLSNDSLAEKIITRVSKSVFGPQGRRRSEQAVATTSRNRRRPDKEQQQMSNGAVIYSSDNGVPVFNAPSYAWQDHLTQSLAVRNHSPEPATFNDQSIRRNSHNDSYWEGGPRQKRRIEMDEPTGVQGSSQHSFYDPNISEFPPEMVPLDVSGVGQLSLTDDMQVRCFGESSGLPLLSRYPRSDMLYSQQTWRFPKMLHRLPTNNATCIDNGDSIRLPSRSTQERLLRQYFHYVHPILPVMDRAELWDDWSSTDRLSSSGPKKLLLLSIFALASCYDEAEYSHRSPQDSALQGLGSIVMAFDDSEDGISSSSHISTCQALLILAYQAIGIYGTLDVSPFLARGIQMSLDLGLHRRADGWAPDGEYIFSASTLRVRSCIWYGFVIIDSLVAAQLGRLPRIRHEDYDVILPDIDSHEDVRLWMPHRTQSSTQGCGLLLGRMTSCFRYVASLAELFSSVLHKLYSVTSARTMAEKYSEAIDLEHRLQKWYLELPEALRSTISPVSSPQIFCLHMFYWCATLLVHRSFLSRDTIGEQPQRALDFSATAAINLTTLAHTYQSTFGAKHAPILFVYYLLISGATHIMILQMRPEDIQAKAGINTCLSFLQEMKATWPAASLMYTLLECTKVVRDVPPPKETRDNQKRPHEESCHESGSLQELGTGGSQRFKDIDVSPSPFVTLAYSLGLDPTAVNNLFIPEYYAWPAQ